MLIACYSHAMSNLQIKNMPEDLHRLLRERSAKRGLTMRDYVLGLIDRDMRQPTVSDWLERLAASGQRPRGGTPAAELIQRTREERDRQIDVATKRRSKPGGRTTARSGR